MFTHAFYKMSKVYFILRNYELKLAFKCDQPYNRLRCTEKLQTRCARKPDAAFGIIFFRPWPQKSLMPSKCFLHLIKAVFFKHNTCYINCPTIQ